MRPRITVFPEMPEALLIVTAGGFMLPAIHAPFTKASVQEAIRAIGVDARVVEGTPGRWTSSIARAKAEERSERAQRQRQAEAARTMIMRSSNDDLERGRAKVIEELHGVDCALRAVKQQLGEAKSDSHRGVFMEPKKFRALEAEMRTLQDRSIAIQGVLGELKKRQKEKTRQEANTWAERFVKAARELLDEETLAELEGMVQGMEINEQAEEA